MLTIFAAAILSTQTIDGQLVETGGDYVLAAFEVPAGAIEMTISRVVADDANVVDFGVLSPDGFRGWGGGLKEDAIVGVDESSRGYLPGPLTAGTWYVVVGRALLTVAPADFQITVTIRDDATLPVRTRAAFADVAIESGARWYAGDLHVHSSESGDSQATYTEITALARERGLDFVVLSEHNTISGHALQAAAQGGAAPLLIRGNEVTTYGGHGNALSAAAPIDHRVGEPGRDISVIIDDAVAAGGSFVINHPALELGGACIGCAWSYADETPWDRVAAIEIHTGPFSVAELFGKPARAMWDAALDSGFKVTAVGGSDDHRAGIDLSPTQSPIGSPTTLVYAEELSESAIVSAIAAGRVVVLQSGPTDPRADLEIESDSGERGAIGDTISGDAITVRARVTGGDGQTAVLVESGIEKESLAIVGDDATLEWSVKVPSEGARYRVHIIVGIALTTVTNHVYVEFAEGPSSGCGCSGGGGAGGGAWLLALVLALIMARRRRGQRRTT